MAGVPGILKARDRGLGGPDPGRELFPGQAGGGPEVVHKLSHFTIGPRLGYQSLLCLGSDPSPPIAKPEGTMRREAVCPDA